MITRLHSIILLLLTICIIYIAWQSARSSKIAYVDSVRLLNEYRAMIDARKDFADKTKVWQSNIDSLTNEVQQSIQQYERSISTSTRNTNILRNNIQRKQDTLLKYQRTIQENARQEEQAGTQIILNQVNSYLSRYGQNHGYEFILIATQAGSIAYANKQLDITDEVIQELNSEYIKPRNKQ